MSLKTTAGRGGDSLTGVIQATHDLTRDVGPEWGLAIVVAIMLFFPKWGVIVSLAKLWKEDRADDRKRKVESERLTAKLQHRPQAKNPSGSTKSLPGKK